MNRGGRLVLGSYELLIGLASGGMATVHVARQVGAGGFERLVAVKRVHPHLLANREFYDMFRDEARVSSMIRHPNVVSASDVVEAHGELFLVMDYVEAVSLAALREPGGIPPAVASRILVDVLGGLHAAHEAVDLQGRALELIHRDVSPQNVIVGVDGASRLIDFGIAKAAARLAETSGIALRGKLRYMSPEQIRQKPLDRRADIFAAGVVLHELLTGRRLFEGEDEGDIALGVMLGDIPPPSLTAPDVTPALDAVVLRALARDRDERFGSAAEMQSELERAYPPAPHRELARWLESRVGEDLARRRTELRAALAGGRSEGRSRLEDDGTIAAASSTNDSPSDERPKLRRWTTIGALAGIAASAVTAAAIVVPRLTSSSGTSTPAADLSEPVIRAPSSVASSPPPPASATPDAAEADASDASATRPARPPQRPAPKPRGTGDLHRNPYAR